MRDYFFRENKDKDMLEGTDLGSAWGPLLPQANASSQQQQQQYYDDMDNGPANQPTVQHQAKQLIASQSVQQQPDNDYQQMASAATAGSFNDQYEKEQKLIAIINELKRRQASGGAASNQPSYWDKLAAKKKDLVKFFQSALIIVFALSVHFLIQHYFQAYISSNDVSFERELIMRLLYPIGIAFIAWNIMLIYK